MACVTVLLNRGSGTVAADPKIADKVHQAFKARNLDVRVELVSGAECSRRCKEAAERQDELLVVGGGDGTISAAASALIGTETLLGVLPLGTLNHFARDLNIPSDLDEAVNLIASRRVKRVDLGEMNDRIFINNSAIGLYPLMVVDRDLQRRKLGRSKGLAMIIASARTLLRFGHLRLTLTVNDEKGRVDTPLLFVGNNDYRLDIEALGKRDSLEGGRLCVLVMRKKTRRGFIAASLRALFDHSRSDDMVRLDEVERLRVSTLRPELAVSLDGEVTRIKPPLDYRIRKRALRVVAG